MDELYEDFIEKTDYLTETKGLLKDRINSLGGSITSGTTFRDYLVWLDSLYEALEEKTITGLPDSLEGKCEQEGTPTPDSPIAVETTTGRQVVGVVGKNLFTTGTGTSTRIQVETTYNGSEIILNGTTNNSGNIFYDETLSINTGYRKSQFLKAGTYTLTTKTTGTATYPSGVGIAFYIRDGSGNVLKGISSINNYQTTLTLENDTQIYSQFYCNGAGAVYDNYTLQVQIEKGNTPSTYEEYKGENYDINLGKNLLKYPYYETTKTISDVTFTDNGNGTITVNGTNSSSSQVIWYFTEKQWSWNYLSLQLEAGTYTFKSIGTDKVTLHVNAYKSDNTNEYFGIQKADVTKTFNVPVRLNVRLGVASGVNVDNYTIYPQIEKGSQATSYTPYKTPIYLGKIGTYQDYIFRNTTENPLYDSNLEEGQWYIHKEIARIDMSTISSFNRASSWNNQTAFYAVNAINHGYTNYDKVADIYCNRLVSNQPALIVSNSSNTGQIGLGANVNIFFSISGLTTSADYVNYFKNNPTILYCRLATPTTTLIEDEELINQLNEIEIFTVISEDFYN